MDRLHVRSALLLAVLLQLAALVACSAVPLHQPLGRRAGR